jgi:hypothetical protein
MAFCAGEMLKAPTICGNQLEKLEQVTMFHILFTGTDAEEIPSRAYCSLFLLLLCGHSICSGLFGSGKRFKFLELTI